MNKRVTPLLKVDTLSARSQRARNRDRGSVFDNNADLSPQSGLPEIRIQTATSIIETLELRTAIEAEAAALAAARRSPAQEAQMIDDFEAFRILAQRAEPTSNADFAFHIAVARGANNTCLARYLELMGPPLIPRSAVWDSDTLR
ncbi:FCD domain-containing protein [Rhizobium sp. BK376]|uniref:FCD domain-containing protein n=1 Tax=Rhizobium sp. BK376 TaxID=2512149 RepID=UPI0010E100B2|nr:FCD domain-containing protein [Rhizobium sp. BK376]TCR70713.1 FCD domain-containing protein [Rhizobium sp. BK376]